jgi:nucleosome binding factor SPN SPT16 subunit
MSANLTNLRKTMPASQPAESTHSVPKPTKAKQTIEQQIEALEAKTRKLKEQLKEDQRREREKNAKAVLELLKSEKLEDFGIEAWKAKIGDVRKLLESAKV